MISVKTRGREDTKSYDDPSIVTVGDLKTRLCPADPSTVLLTFKGKILSDTTPLCVLGDNPVFTVEREIEFMQIEKGKYTVNGERVSLGPQDVFYKDGRAYMVTSRVKKFRLRDVVVFIRNNVSRAQLIQALFLAVVVFSRNYPLLVVIMTINLLRAFSYALVRSKAWNECRSHLSYALFMFIASLFSIDHEKFIRTELNRS